MMTPTYSSPTATAPAWTPAPGAKSIPGQTFAVGFFLFILVNAALFMRPTEIFPEYMYVQTYLVLILACFTVSMATVGRQLNGPALTAQPITVCVFMLVLAVILSHLARLALEDAVHNGSEFSKVALYYLLVIGLITTPWRLQHFLLWMAAFIFVHIVVAVLQFHHLINAPYFGPMVDSVAVDQMGRDVRMLRLIGSGIFANPNEVCYPIGFAIMICLYEITRRQALVLRVLCLAALPVFGYAMTLTHSRGGFIGLLMGVMTYLFARFGWRKALPFAAFLLPVLFVLFAGRQTDLTVSSGTGQQRIQLWNDGLVLFTKAPFFGVGTGLFREEIGWVCHNSFIQAYSELGFFGGTFFVGAFYCAIVNLMRLGASNVQLLDPDMARLRPYLLGLVVGFMGCMLTMSLIDMLPTYTVLGLVVAFRRVTPIRPPAPRLPELSGGLLLRMAGVSLLTLLAFRLYVWQYFVPG